MKYINLHSEYLIDSLQKISEELNVPGPNIEKHKDGYNSICFCKCCLTIPVFVEKKNISNYIDYWSQSTDYKNK